MKKTINYEDAVQELEQIVRQMENDELDIDVLCEKLKRAQKFIKMWQDNLHKTDEENKKLLGNGEERN